MSTDVPERASAVAPAEETAPQRRQGIALCLSGGGYRATLFHLGAVRRLHELGLLQRLRTVSSVSGGTIFAAMLARTAMEAGRADLKVADYDADVAAPVRSLTATDLRTSPFLRHALWNWAAPGPRAKQLERLFARHVSGAKLADLPERPNFIFCATDITFGVSWESSRTRTGSWQAGYLKDGAAWPIARAVAASACFPPVFGPLPVGAASSAFARGRVPKAEGEPLRGRLALSDGGVYDNMGLEPVWNDHECLLVSDGGAPFEFAASANPARRLMRYTTVVQNQAQSLRRRMFFAGIREERYRGTRWAIRGSSPAPGGYSAELVTERVGQVRTDLDRFSEAERCILENHGYTVADAAVQKRLGDLVPADAPPARAPNPEWMDEDRVRHALRNSHRRIDPARMLGVTR